MEIISGIKTNAESEAIKLVKEKPERFLIPSSKTTFPLVELDVSYMAHKAYKRKKLYYIGTLSDYGEGFDFEENLEQIGSLLRKTIKRDNVEIYGYEVLCTVDVALPIDAQLKKMGYNIHPRNLLIKLPTIPLMEITYSYETVRGNKKVGTKFCLGTDTANAFNRWNEKFNKKHPNKMILNAEILGTSCLGWLKSA